MAAPAVKLSKRLEPWMPAIVDKLGPLAIAVDAAALAAVSYVVVKPRLDVSRQLAAAKKSGQLPPGARVVRVEPAGVHGESATVLDPVRGDAALEGVDVLTGMTVAETDPNLLDRVAESGVTIDDVDPRSLRERLNADVEYAGPGAA